MILALLACVAETALTPWGGTVSVSPEDGAEHVSAETAVRVAFSAPPPDGSRVWMDGGATLRGGWTAPSLWEGSLDEPLARDTTYHLLVTAGLTDFVGGFHTVGAPLAADILCHTYMLDLEDLENLTWIEPAQGQLLSRLLAPGSGVLLMVREPPGATLELVGTIGQTVGGVLGQQSDVPTFPLDSASFADNPLVQVTAAEITLPIQGVDFHLYEVAFLGEFQVDGAAILDLNVRAILDGRPFESAFGCDDFGDCALCPDQTTNEEPACLPLEFELAEAPWIEGLVIEGYGDCDP